MPDHTQTEKQIGALVLSKPELLAELPYLTHVTDRLKHLSWPVLNALYVRKQDIREEVVRRQLGERMRKVFELPAFCRIAAYKIGQRINLNEFVNR